MASILVDYENVNGSNGLRGVDALSEDDILIIFYSGCCEKVRYDYMQEIRESGCEFRVIKLKGSGKNALDFYIAAECGVLSERGERQIAIISNDKGFQAVIDFFCMDSMAAKIQIVRAGNVENALTAFSDPGNDRRREILHGTAYEEKTAEIIDFIDLRKKQGRKALYTGSLQRFGRKDGTAIYRLIKSRMEDMENANNF